jgi:uncharacterized protein DUF3850
MTGTESPDWFAEAHQILRESRLEEARAAIACHGGTYMKIHSVKSWPDFFVPVFYGDKTFELRRDDRCYAVGDVIRLHEYDDRAGKFTGRVCCRMITYILRGVGPGAITPLLGLARGYAILGLGDDPYVDGQSLPTADDVRGILKPVPGDN